MYKTVKQIEQKLGDPNMTLDSYIVTPTDHADIQWFGEEGQIMTKREFAENHVLFQYDDRTTYISRLFGLIVTP
jgi:hypothetical protein